MDRAESGEANRTGEAAGPVTDDAFLGGRLQLLQPAKGYRAGVDAVLLGAVAGGLAKAGSPDAPIRVLDLGAGVGTVGLCIARLRAGARITLLEREAELARLARDNAARNGLDARVTVFESDVTTSAETLAALGLAPDGFDCVVANPPFHAEGAGTGSATLLKARAHAMAAGDIDQWARVMARHAAPGGCMVVIHKAEALGPLLGALDQRFGSIRILPIQARANEPAIRVIVSGVKGSRAPLVLLPPFSLHEADGTFTPQASAVLRGGVPLALA